MTPLSLQMVADLLATNTLGGLAVFVCSETEMDISLGTAEQRQTSIKKQQQQNGLGDSDLQILWK